jgi:N-acyl-phosphatidylethanolamine-hydrolysing phospholipase D
MVLRGRDVHRTRTAASVTGDAPGTTRVLPARPPHHTPDGKFRNPWPDSTPRGFADLLKWTWERRGKPLAPTPARGSFPTATPVIARPRAGTNEHTATWIGHSTILLQTAGLNIITDPVFSERAFPVQWAGPKRVMPPAMTIEALPPLDIVLLSHIHYDHLDKPAVKQLARTHPLATWIVPLGVGAYVRGWGVREIVELDWWQETEVKGVRVAATPARHFSARRIGDRYKSLWCGFALAIGERRVYFAGDTAYHPEFATIGDRYGPFDFVMMPIGAYDPRWFMHVVHVDPIEAVQAYTDLLAPHAGASLPLMLGIHWGTFRLTDEPMDEPPVRTRVQWREQGLADAQLWVAKFGETRSW